MCFLLLLLKYRTQANVNIVNLLSIKTENRLHSHKNAFMAPARKAFLVFTSNARLHSPISQYGCGFLAAVPAVRNKEIASVHKRERERKKESKQKSTRNKLRNWGPLRAKNAQDFRRFHVYFVH